MKFFQKVAENVDVFPLLHAIQKQPELFNSNRHRTTFPGTPFAEVDDILLRFTNTETFKFEGKDIGDSVPVFHPAWEKLPQAKPIIANLMHRVGGYELGRVMVSKLTPGARVLPHTDNQTKYTDDADRARYHICLQGLPGSNYRTGDEIVNMRTGEIWWFDARTEHEVYNNSSDDRIHLLVDFRCF